MSDLLRMIRFLIRPTADTRSVRGQVAGVLIAGALSGLASAGLLIQINRAISHANDLTMGLIWTFVGLCLLLPLARFVSQVLLARLTQGTLRELRMSLAQRILSAPLRQLEEIGPHRMMASLTDDTSTLREVLGSLPLLFMHLTVVVVCLVYLGWISGWLLLIVIGFLGLGVVSYRLAMLRAVPFFRRVQAGSDRLMKSFRGLTDGTKELKLHQPRRLAFLRQLLDTTLAIQRDNMSGIVIHAGANSWGQILSFLLIATIFFLYVAQKNVSREALTGTVLVILYMRTPLDIILQMIPSLSRASIAMQRIKQIGDLLSHSEIADQDLPIAEGPAEWRSLRLAGVTHSYRREADESSFLLGPIDLEITAGELIFLVGGNGSGKTTLAKLILGLYLPEAGEILFDGKPVTDETRESYRRCFTAVFSDFFLFESLLGFEPGAQIDDHARGYLQKLHLDKKVEVKDGKLSTTALSQGQRKRLALLTAYLEDRPIFLFDEWAADQDPYFKEIFYLELLPELKARKKTVIVISHDDRYYDVADRILKIENGQLRYDGDNGGYLASLSAGPLRQLANDRH